MIGKLFKYDFKALMRYLLPLYGALIISSVLTAVSVRNSHNGTVDELYSFNNNIITNIDIIKSSLIMVYTILAIAATVLTTVLIIVRFYKNLIGNEGYMMFALPVKTSTHLIEKVLSGFFWSFIGLIVLFLSILIIIIFGTDISFSEFIKGIGNGWQFLVDSSYVGDFFLLLGICLLGIIGGIIKIYAVLAIGHQWSAHKILGCFIAYIGISIMENIVSQTFLVTIILSGEYSFDAIYLPLYIIVSAKIIVYGVISWFLLDRRLNLE